MAVNPASQYGHDIRCVSDADELWSEVEGLEVVKQDAIHRLTTKSVLGPSDTQEEINAAADWGTDCVELLGMNERELMTKQAEYSIILQKDTRITEADVTLTKVTTNGKTDVKISAFCMTAEGPFDFTKTVLELTSSYAEGQA